MSAPLAAWACAAVDRDVLARDSGAVISLAVAWAGGVLLLQVLGSALAAWLRRAARP